jgi:DNA invertase Pin-like site-specific DNA recombinase
MTKAAIYARVSTDRQDSANQMPDLQNYATFKRLDIVQTFADEMSGRKADRPALQAMLAAARRHEFDVLLVWKLDRLGRSAKHLLQVLDELAELGISFVSVTQALDTSTASGKLLFTVLGAVAEFESALISERTAAGMASARKRGVKLGRTIQIDHAKVHALRASGQTQVQIATAMGIHVETIRRIERERRIA